MTTTSLELNKNLGLVDEFEILNPIAVKKLWVMYTLDF